MQSGTHPVSKSTGLHRTYKEHSVKSLRHCDASFNKFLSSPTCITAVFLDSTPEHQPRGHSTEDSSGKLDLTLRWRLLHQAQAQGLEVYKLNPDNSGSSFSASISSHLRDLRGNGA